MHFVLMSVSRVKKPDLLSGFSFCTGASSPFPLFAPVKCRVPFLCFLSLFVAKIPLSFLRNSADKSLFMCLLSLFAAKLSVAVHKHHSKTPPPGKRPPCRKGCPDSRTSPIL